MTDDENETAPEPPTAASGAEPPDYDLLTPPSMPLPVAPPLGHFSPPSRGDSASSTGPLSVPDLVIRAGGPPVRRRRRWPWAIFVVVVAAVAVASRINLNYYAIQPGQAQSVQQFITVPSDKAHRVTHPMLLTDVEIGRVTALSYLYYQLKSDTDLEKVVAITGGTAPSELIAQGNQEMSQAEDDAKTAALSRLGYKVTTTSVGAVIVGVWEGTPAYGELGVGDVITAVDGKTTKTAGQLTGALSHLRSGDKVTMTVLRQGRGRPTGIPVVLKTTTVVDGYNANGSLHTVRLDLGIEVEDQIAYHFPFPVTVNIANIGGPSAGLAMTLGLMDALTNGSLTGGHTVAATGTIDSYGNVGDVGGVHQKTIAVERAGATIFLVPPQEYKAALSKDRPGLKIYAVSTLDQALAVLKANGGAVPADLTTGVGNAASASSPTG